MTSPLRRVQTECGVALVIALMATTLMLTLGCALVLLSSSETVITANFRAAHEAAYAADAAMERALADLRNVPDWTTVLSGGARSSFADGAPSGGRTLADGVSIDLAQVTNLANCQKPTVCDDAEIAAITADRPWGANNPRWTLYAYGPLADMLGATTVRSAFYVLAFVGDDSSENDDDSTRDGVSVAGEPNPGRAILAVRAEAFGPRNAHRVIEATVARLEVPPEAPGEPASTELHVLSWRDVR
jgi:Tfp pilus assembly protein PilX